MSEYKRNIFHCLFKTKCKSEENAVSLHIFTYKKLKSEENADCFHIFYKNVKISRIYT